MFTFLQYQRKKFLFSSTTRLLVCLLSFSLVLSPPASYAQTFLNLPAVGTMVSPSPAFVPVLLKGMTIHPENPLQFDFIIDTGNSGLDIGNGLDRSVRNARERSLKAESEKLIKYFLASMTVPKDDLWVNLSPYEKDRIIPEALGNTELGRDMLAQDYILKQLTASLMYPEEELGKTFWDKVYKQAQEQFGTTDIPVNTFNKVWILPETATVYEHEQTVYIVDSHLKVMLDEDYVAQQSDARYQMLDTSRPSGIQHPVSSIQDQNSVSTSIIHEIIIPAIEQEVNHGQHFAPLRQIYHSLILAKWYKETIKDSLLSEVYVDQNKIEGVDLKDKTIKDQIYAQYMEAYKKGVYDYIKEDYVAMEFQQNSTATSRAPARGEAMDFQQNSTATPRLSSEAKHEKNLVKEEVLARDDALSQEVIPRKYFSGGLGLNTNVPLRRSSSPVIGNGFEGRGFRANIRVTPTGDGRIASSPVKRDEELGPNPVPIFSDMFYLDPETSRIRFNDTMKGPIFNLGEIEIFGTRHGQTPGNVRHRREGAIYLSGTADDPVMNQLDEVGRRQADDLVDTLVAMLQEQIRLKKKIVIVTGTQGRVVDTATPSIEYIETLIEESDLFKVVRDPRLNEMNYGSVQNKDGSDFTDEEHDQYRLVRLQMDATAAFPGGETPIDLMKSSLSLLSDIKRDHQGATVILFSHGMRLAAIRALLGDRTLVDETGQIDWVARQTKVQNGEVRLLHPTASLLASVTDPSQSSSPGASSPLVEPRITVAADLETLDRIGDRALWLAANEVHQANLGPKKPDGIKVGGHQAAIASASELWIALRSAVARGYDSLAPKPHAGPIDHAYDVLTGALNAEELFHLRDVNVGRAPYADQDDEAKALAEEAERPKRPRGFVAYPGVGELGVEIPAGSVGMPPAVTIALAINDKRLRERNQKSGSGYEVIPDKHYWALVGDAEEFIGNLQEMLHMVRKYGITNVTHIIDYNRQSLDGNTADDRLQTIIERRKAAGWTVVELKWGKYLQSAIDRDDGGDLFEQIMLGLSHHEYQDWVAHDSNYIRKKLIEKSNIFPRIETFLEEYNQGEALYELITDLGGHDTEGVIKALVAARKSNKSVVIIAHTIKGKGLRPLMGMEGNHGALLTQEDMDALREELGVPPIREASRGTEESEEDRHLREVANAFPIFDKGSGEAELLKSVTAELNQERDRLEQLKGRNKAQFDREWQEHRQSLPTRINFRSPFPYMSIQDYSFAVVNKLRRIAATRYDDLKKESEKALKPLADRFVTISPDVGSTTGLGRRDIDHIPAHYREGIEEMNAATLAVAMGKSEDFTGSPAFPYLTIYDVFMFQRAYAPLVYGQYWNSSFIAFGTPAGSTLFPEGSQHQEGISPIIAKELPNAISWDPAFLEDFDFIFTDALIRQAENNDEGRNFVYLRGTTKANKKDQLIELLRINPAYNGVRDDEEIWAHHRENVLKGGYRLVDYSQEEGYDPNENVVNLVVTGTMVTEALKASQTLATQGIFANVIVITSADLVLGDKADDNRTHLNTLIPKEERTFTPVSTWADASKSYLEGIGDTEGFAMTVKNFGLKRIGTSTRTLQAILEYHGISDKHMVSQAKAMLDNLSADYRGVVSHMLDALAIEADKTIRAAPETSLAREEVSSPVSNSPVKGTASSPVDGKIFNVETPAALAEVLGALENLRVLGRSDRQRKFRQEAQVTVDRIVSEELAAALDRVNSIDPFRESYDKLTEKFWGLAFPVEYGGKGLGVVEESIATELLGARSQSLGLLMDVGNPLSAFPIYFAGTKEQKRKYLPGMFGSSPRRGSFGLTEISGGSDAANNIQTIVEWDDAAGGYRIIGGNAGKIYNTGGNDPQTNKIILFAVTDPQVPSAKGLSAFVVKIREDNGTPVKGVNIIHQDGMLGERGTETAQFFFDEGFFIPKDALLDGSFDGKEGGLNRGFTIAMRTLEAGRISISSLILGALRAIVREATDEFGTILDKRLSLTDSEKADWHQGLSKMAADEFAARMLLMHAAEKKDNGEEYNLDAALAKVKPAEDARRNARLAQRLIGLKSLKKGHHLERLFRDILLLTIGEGTTEVMRVVIKGELMEARNRRMQRLDPLEFNKAVLDKLSNIDASVHERIRYLVGLNDANPHKNNPRIVTVIEQMIIDLYAQGRAVRLMEEAANAAGDNLAKELAKVARRHAIDLAEQFFQLSKDSAYINPVVSQTAVPVKIPELFIGFHSIDDYGRMLGLIELVKWHEVIEGYGEQLPGDVADLEDRYVAFASENDPDQPVVAELSGSVYHLRGKKLAVIAGHGEEQATGYIVFADVQGSGLTAFFVEEEDNHVTANESRLMGLWDERRFERKMLDAGLIDIQLNGSVGHIIGKVGRGAEVWELIRKAEKQGVKILSQLIANDIYRQTLATAETKRLAHDPTKDIREFPQVRQLFHLMYSHIKLKWNTVVPK